MKRTVLCIFLVLVLMGGGLFAGGRSQSSRNSITVSTFAGDPYQSAWRAMFDKFQTENGTTVIQDAIPWENMREKHILELSSGSGSYDVLLVHPFWFEDLVSNGYLYSIDDYCTSSERGQFVENLLNIYAYNGKVYGLPDWIATQILAYRKDLFQNAGLSAPKNWADILNAADKLADGDNVYGITFPARKGGALAGIFSTCLLSNGGWVVDKSGKPSINSDAAVETAEFMKNMSKYAPTGYQNFHWQENATVAYNGKAAMIMLMTPNVTWLEDPSQSETVGKWVYLPISNKVNGGMIDSYCWSLAKNTKNLDAAAKLVKFLAMNTDVQVYLTEKMGTASSTKSYYENRNLLESHPELTAMNLAFQNAAPNPSWSSWGAEQDVLETGLQDLFNGRGNAKAMLDAVQAKMLESPR